MWPSAARVSINRFDHRQHLGHVRKRTVDVMALAGLKAVGESVEKPLLYYENNVGGTFVLLAAMQAHGVRRIVFSSSATVYGDPERRPIAETHPLRATNPYGRTKLIVEQVLADQAAAQAGFVHASLRYFNPTGAHPSGVR